MFVRRRKSGRLRFNMNGYYFWRLANPSETGMEPATSRRRDSSDRIKCTSTLPDFDLLKQPKTMHVARGCLSKW